MRKYASFLDAQMQRELEDRAGGYSVEAFDESAHSACKAELDQLVNRLEREGEALEALADIRQCLNIKVASNERLTHFEAQMVHLTFRQAGMSSMSPAVEAMDETHPAILNASIENISEHLKKTWEWIKEMIRKLIDWVKGFFASKKIDNIAKNAETMAADIEPAMEKAAADNKPSQDLKRLAYRVAQYIRCGDDEYDVRKNEQHLKVTTSALRAIISLLQHAFTDAVTEEHVAASADKLDHEIQQIMKSWKRINDTTVMSPMCFGQVIYFASNPATSRYATKVPLSLGLPESSRNLQAFMDRYARSPKEMIGVIRDASRSLRSDGLPGIAQALRECRDETAYRAADKYSKVSFDGQRRAVDKESEGILSSEDVRRIRNSMMSLNDVASALVDISASVGYKTDNLKKHIERIKNGEKATSHEEHDSEHDD